MYFDAIPFVLILIVEVASVATTTYFIMQLKEAFRDCMTSIRNYKATKSALEQYRYEREKTERLNIELVRVQKEKEN